MNIGIFIQARIGSRRLPKKILRALGPKTLIELVVDRFRKIKHIVRDIYILTNQESYSYLQTLFRDSLDITLFLGSEENVLDRFYWANQKFKKDVIIRATGDNPFVSMGHVISALQHHKKHCADLTHYLKLPLGSGVEIISESALNSAYAHAHKDYQQEHVTPYIYENKDQFNVIELQASGIYDRSEIRITVDEEKDFRVVEKIVQKLYKSGNDFPLATIINAWDEEELNLINGDVQQIKISPKS